ncbi:hypothetical protein MOB65_20115 [Bacillus inaquosorum]|uniref:hypothetical protein n=1 Tax=Bacillus inaquosorum TaxID=483913 RepID=UPI00227EADAB|nr:hypothetical protein [Bacillus inaquosorum]MCY7911163.1 hypothetical protein [Bacillus inaquosorum]
MTQETLRCDHCGEGYRHAPIVEQPTRFGYKGRIHQIAQINNDGREVDNICIHCLIETIDNLKEIY